MEEPEIKPTWLCAVQLNTGVQFTGTMEEAQEHLNSYVGFLEVVFREKGLKFLRMQHRIVREGYNVDDDINDDNGKVDVNDLDGVSDV